MVLDQEKREGGQKFFHPGKVGRGSCVILVGSELQNFDVGAAAARSAVRGKGDNICNLLPYEV